MLSYVVVGSHCCARVLDMSGRVMVERKTTSNYDLGSKRVTGLPDYVTPDGVPMWMVRPGQKTWFVDAEGVQHGPTHRNMVPAVIWATAEGWYDPSVPAWLNAGAYAEVMSGGAALQEGQRR